MARKSGNSYSLSYYEHSIACGCQELSGNRTCCSTKIASDGEEDAEGRLPKKKKKKKRGGGGGGGSMG